MSDDFQRSSDFIIGELVSEVKSLRLAIEDREITSNEWRERFDARLKPVEELNQKLKTPITVLAWLIGGPIALWAVNNLIKWFDGLWSHVQIK